MPVEERICSIHDLEPGEAREFDLGTTAVCVARFEDRWCSIDNKCTYDGASLAEGTVDAASFAVSCRQCGSTFSLQNGGVMSPPATEPERAYEVRIYESDVLVVVA